MLLQCGAKLPAISARRDGTATSASWNITYFEWRTTFDPILINFSRKVSSIIDTDLLREGYDSAKKIERLVRQVPV